MAGARSSNLKERKYGVPDEENPEWTDEMFARGIPFPEFARQHGLKIPGRPKAEITKQPVSLRLDPEIVAHFKAGGAGWQTRINAVLGKHVKAANAAARRKKRA